MAEPVAAKSVWKLRWKDPTDANRATKTFIGSSLPPRLPMVARIAIPPTHGATCVSATTDRFPLRGSTSTLPADSAISLLERFRRERHSGGRYLKNASGCSQKLLRWTGPIVCTTCHPDVHKGQFKQKMPKGCETCLLIGHGVCLYSRMKSTKFLLPERTPGWLV